MTKEGDKRQEEQRVEEELSMNTFPREVIMRVKKMARKINQEKERSQDRTGGDTGTGKQTKRTVTIPYIKGMSQAIRRVLAPLGIRTAMRSERMKWSVLRGVKDREDKTEVPGAVYAEVLGGVYPEVPGAVYAEVPGAVYAEVLGAVYAEVPGAVYMLRCRGLSMLRCWGLSMLRCRGLSMLRCRGLSMLRCRGLSMLRCRGLSMLRPSAGGCLC